ncbi:MAG: Aliphatic sulfonates import ATP-binding protein SsuB [Chlamydiales bacterium]|nr:Aliphatic sulfonates import ATP-binding protein SsuB [Chlamydiales bacterium]MCH9620191.1 Aliphatic sulfonates import ATP-binding protein SsuB [Chlamydiales bacterium]MCH9623094.1 Aliphatic sulfonates import ATP-binding protein SsuB [Chlamydiales bacterium]
MLSVEDVYFGYDHPILKGISFKASPGEILALIGTSGSGKTTLFKLITGLLTPDRGDVHLEGLCTYMQQEDLLLPWRSVLENILLPCELGPSPAPALKSRAKQLLNLVGLPGCEEMYPSELSGGMRQRVALARTLIQECPLMLLDEPFGSLDVLIREQLYFLLKQIRDAYGKTIVLITHDFHDAIALADRVLVLSLGQIMGDFSTEDRPAEELKKSIRHCLEACAGQVT